MRIALKILLHWLSILIVLPLLACHAFLLLFASQGIFVAASQLLSMIPGKPGNYLRAAFYRCTMSRCDREVAISFGTVFSHKDTEIGKGVYIGPQSNIGMSRIGANCLFGSGVHLLSGKRQHNFESLEVPIQQQGGNYEKLEIGEDSWIGNGAIILANIGSHCVVGAGSVVMTDVPDYAVVGGNPARVLKMRN